jgi:alpha-amylase
MRRPSLQLAAILFALAACARAPAVPSSAGRWWEGAVFYEVFVRSYQDSDGDGIGDLRGLAARLDHLNDGRPETTTDLEVDALWLMPVFASPSYHGYDVTDYEAVNPDYGTNDDLAALVRAAHGRGMKVILDLMLNHTSDQHPWFKDSASGPSSPHRGWYVWSATDPGWTQPWNPASQAWHERNGAYYYGVFWGGMPDLNFRNAAVRAEAKRLAKLWLDRGVDGFRLDAVRHLVEDGPGPGQSGSPETHAFLREFAAAVRAAKAEAVLVGEVWSNTLDIGDYYGKGDELQALFDFPLQTAIVSGLTSGSAEPIAVTLEEVRRTYPPGAVDAPFLANHDQIRLATQLGNDPAKLRLAAAILLTLPGAPFVYYGEELGLQNRRSSDDEWKRTPMPWDGSTPGHGFTTGKPWQRFTPEDKTSVAAQAADPGSLLSRYRAFIRARKASPALRRGDLAPVPVPAAPALLAYVRRGGGETVLVAHNLGTSPLDAPLGEVGAGAPVPLLVDAGGELSRNGPALRLRLAPAGSGIWQLR